MFEEENTLNNNDESNVDMLRAKKRTYLNRSKMKTYQNNNWNKAGKFGSDCTNYASNVVRAGGAPHDKAGKYVWYYNNGIFDTYSRSWTVVWDFRDYFINNNESNGTKVIYTPTFKSMEEGDTIQMKLKPSKDYNHAAIVHTRGGDPIVTAHTNNYKGRFAEHYNKYITATYKIHFIGYY